MRPLEIHAIVSDGTSRPATVDGKVQVSVGEGRIEIQGVSMVFRDRARATLALEEVELDIGPGEFVALLGPSGCGKSTLLNAIAGRRRPTIGIIEIDGATVTGPNENCGIVFQHHSLFPWMSVIENVAFGPRMLGAPDALETARRFLKLVGLAAYADAWPATLSGGMQQRVGIARALATSPRVLLMDEPFGALDAQTRSVMQEELLKLWSKFGNTIVFVTHDVDEAIFLADRVIVMRTLPGGVKRDLAIDLPRPRPRTIIGSERFGRYRGEILDLIREEVSKVFVGPTEH